MKKVTMYRVELVKESCKLYEIDTTIDSSPKAPVVLRAVLDLEKWHNERFGIACLNMQNKLIGMHIVNEGTVNEISLYIREIALRVLLNNASKVILFHNHPSGSLKPSSCDLQATKQINQAMKILEIQLVDHVILTENSYFSFAEGGLL